MRALALPLALAAVALVIWAGVAARAWLNKRKAETEPWSLAEASDNRGVTVYACRPGFTAQVVGTAYFSEADFDDQLLELRSEGEYKVATLNSDKVPALKS